MKKSLSVFLIIVSVIVVLAVAAAATLSVMTYLKVSAIEAAQTEEIPEGSVEGEDNIEISGGYWIRSTRAISDAYLSGDSSALSERDAETLAMASDILDKIITDTMSDYEKEQAVFNWMSDNIGLDAEVTVLVRDDISTDNPHGVLSGRQAVCVGYATTFRLFMQMLDIPCMVVHNSELVHTWDLVQIDGHWYHTDLYSAHNAADPTVYLNRSDLLQRELSGQSWDTSFYPAADSLERCYLYEHAARLSDVYAIPSTVKTAIEGEKGYVSALIPKGEEIAPIAGQMLITLEDRIMTSEEYADYGLSHSTVVTDDGSLLAIIEIYNYAEDDDDADTDVSEEELERIRTAITDTFGELTPRESDYSDYSDDAYYDNYGG
jgi:flagellar basal body-associated protein FliL